MSRISEKRDVQDRLIHYLQGQSWTFIPRFDLPCLLYTSDAADE